jgi:hypothetical protein
MLALEPSNAEYREMASNLDEVRANASRLSAARTHHRFRVSES